MQRDRARARRRRALGVAVTLAAVCLAALAGTGASAASKSGGRIFTPAGGTTDGRVFTIVSSKQSSSAETVTAETTLADSSAAATPSLLQSVSVATSAPQTSIAIPAPPGIVAGNVMLAVIDARLYRSGAITPPSGWSLVRRDSGTSQGDFSQAIYVRVTGASEPASYTWTSSASVSLAGAILMYEGVDTANPILASSGLIANSTSRILAPSVAAVTDAAIVGLFGNNGRTTTTPPPGMTERLEAKSSGSDRNITLEAATSLQSPTGPTGDKAAISSSKDYVVVGQLVALAPATGPGGSAPTPSTPPSDTSTPPSNSVPPSVVGTARVASSLTASAGAWSGSTPITFAYQWLRCNSSGAACAPIDGMLSTTYAVVDADLGSTLRVRVTASNTDGSSVAQSAATPVVTSASSSSSPGAGAVQGVSPVKLAYFYMPPTDGTTPQQLAASSSWMVLTYHQEAYRSTLRAAGWTGAISQYVDIPFAQGPAGLTSASVACPSGFSGWGNTITWDRDTFCTRVHAHEDWFLHNGRGERIYRVQESGRWEYFMNPASQGWRDFVASQISWALANLRYDGIFLDDMSTTLQSPKSKGANSDGKVREFSTDSAWVSAMNGVLSAVKAAAGGRPVWINTDNTGAYSAADGQMREDFASSWRGSYWSQNSLVAFWNQLDANVAAGKEFVLVSQGARSDTNRMRYSLAAYLVVAGSGIRFRYHDVNTDYRSLWSYPEYQAALGSPKGKRYQTGTSTWRRDFACGYVLVNISTHTGTITTTACS